MSLKMLGSIIGGVGCLLTAALLVAAGVAPDGRGSVTDTRAEAADSGEASRLSSGNSSPEAVKSMLISDVCVDDTLNETDRSNEFSYILDTGLTWHGGCVDQSTNTVAEIWTFDSSAGLNGFLNIWPCNGGLFQVAGSTWFVQGGGIDTLDLEQRLSDDGGELLSCTS